MGDSIGKHEVYKLRSNHRAHRLKRKVVGRVQKRKVSLSKRGGDRQDRAQKIKILMKTRAFSIFFLHSSEQKVVEQVFRRPYYCIRRPAASQRFVGMGFFSLLSLTKIRPLKINQTNQNSSPGQSLKYDIIRTKL